MSKKRYIVDLTEDECEQVLKLTRKGNVVTRKVTRARILLKADQGWTDEQIVAALDTSLSTVERTRKPFVEGGLPKALNNEPRPGARRKLDGRGEAHLIALTCSEPPDDHDHWTLRVLAQRVMELGMVDSISHEAVRQTLKKKQVKPRQQPTIGIKTRNLTSGARFLHSYLSDEALKHKAHL